MKFRLLLLPVLLLPALGGLCQKPLIDSSVYGKWPSLGDAGINADGRYIFYYVNNQPVGENTLVVTARDGTWKRQFTGAAKPLFSDDGRTLVFLQHDSLFAYRLGSDLKEAVDSALDYEKAGDAGRFIVVRLRGSGDLILKDLVTGKGKRLGNVADFQFDASGRVLVIEIRPAKTDGTGRQLQWIDLLMGKSTIIWSGEHAQDYAFDRAADKMTFLAQRTGDSSHLFSIWYYSSGMSGAKRLMDRLPRGMDSLVIAEQPISFNKDASRIFFRIRKRSGDQAIHPTDSSHVHIWSYRDQYLQSAQRSPDFAKPSRTEYMASYDIRGGTVTRLDDDETMVYPFSGNKDYVLGTKLPTSAFFYDEGSQPATVLVSIKDGHQKYFNGKAIFNPYSLSPDERFVVWFDPDSLAYFCYDLALGSTTNISRSIPEHVYDDLELKDEGSTGPFGVVGWSFGSTGLFLYDAYDIWEVDPKGMRPAINITNGYGRKHGIAFSAINFNESGLWTVPQKNDKLLLAGYTTTTKSSGFWKINLGKPHEDPKGGSTGSYIYYVPRVGYGMVNPMVEYEGGARPLKARDADQYLVKRVSAGSSQNLFTTMDFVTFEPVSAICPEQGYNWLTAEPMKWQTGDGHILEGIVYKPENFDSTKSYPVIFHYYIKKSDGLNGFMPPDYARAVLDIPTYVSNGYVVCVTDIYYPSEYTGAGVVESVESAARCLARFRWVDSTRFGLCGHSFGGWETNFIITHSKLFAAACEAAGVCDQISSYGEITGDGNSRASLYESDSQVKGYGIGNTPWKTPKLYLENSPIFFVDKVSTPLLMMHNPDDGAVPFSQAIEFFTAMKRAGKKVWLLEYEGEGHILHDDRNARDFTIRMMQFFDHYLMGAPPAKWMTQ